ncbi:MAG: long-chain-fatty-acid--CoA ligase [Dehalococcoidia bacterium]
MVVSAARASLKPYAKHPVDLILTKTAAACGSKTAVIDGERRLTFAELDDQASRFAVALHALGIAKGDRVGILAPNCADYVVAFHGISRAGAVVTTLNPSYREREVEFQLNDSGAKALIVAEPLYPLAAAVLPSAPAVERVIVIGAEQGGDSLSFHQLVAQHTGPAPEVAIDPDEDLAALPYSSGTTGLPKGVMLTHANLVSNIQQFMGRQEFAAIGQDDVVQVHLPLYHIYGMNVLMNGSIAAGAAQVLMPRFDMEQCLSLVAQHKITMLYTVPPVILGFVSMPNLEALDLSSIRYFLSGAAPLSEDLTQRFEERTGIPLLQGYGLTETSPLTNADFAEPELHRIGSVGPPVADTEEKVVDLDTGQRELPRGEVGELIIRGPQVMKGYWNNAQATAETLRDGWLYTGDMAKMDDDGFVYIVDRKKELIKYKGFQVAPAELEALLLEHPAIADAAVIGKPDVEAGEVPKAYVTTKGPGATAEEIMAFIEERVAGFKKIREVEFIDQIPKNPSGKVLRRVLVERERQRSGTNRPDGPGSANT